MPCAVHFGVGNRTYLVGWVAIFVIVTFQMSPSLRPIVGPSEETLLPPE